MQAAGLHGAQQRWDLAFPSASPVSPGKRRYLEQTMLKKTRNPRGQHTRVWGVFSVFHNREVRFPNFYSGQVFKPELSSVIARKETRTKVPELSVDIQQILSCCPAPASLNCRVWGF